MRQFTGWLLSQAAGQWPPLEACTCASAELHLFPLLSGSTPTAVVFLRLLLFSVALCCVQLCYGVSIVTFLGAVHWGVAMASPLNNPIALRIANEAFVWSVIPSLISCPVALMQPGGLRGLVWFGCVCARVNELGGRGCDPVHPMLCSVSWRVLRIMCRQHAGCVHTQKTQLRHIL